MKMNLFQPAVEDEDKEDPTPCTNQAFFSNVFHSWPKNLLLSDLFVRCFTDDAFGAHTTELNDTGFESKSKREKDRTNSSHGRAKLVVKVMLHFVDESSS